MQTNCPDIDRVVEKIVSLVKPVRIILFNRKRSVQGDTSSFKLCVIAHTARSQELEQRIYLEVDSEIPFDVVVYTTGQWEELLQLEGSFAQQILSTGRVLYE